MWTFHDGHSIKYLEDKATKRYLMILLCAALLCTCTICLAEEVEIPAGEIIVPSGETETQQGEDAPSAHDESHHTVEQEHGEPFVEKTDSLETHTWITSFDLYCEECGRVIEENVRTEQKDEPHVWDATRKEPTCVLEGSENSVCTVCGAEKTEILPKLDHVYADAALLEGQEAGGVVGAGEYEGLVIGEVVLAPTCTESGEGMLLCLTCQTAVRAVTLPAKGHEWDEWTEIPIPEGEICVSDKMEQRQCGVCGETETRTVSPAPGHQWQETIIKEASCAEQGEVIRKCEVCNAEEQEIVPALGHTFSSVTAFVKHEAGAIMGSDEDEGLFLGEVTVPSTCTENGSGILLCLRCQKEQRNIVIPMGGHHWSDWEQQEIPEDLICVTDMIGVRHCLDCGVEETEVLAPAPGHQWIGVSFTEPTCTEPGQAVRQCAVCQTEEVIETPALGHCFMWMDVKQPDGNTISQNVCTVCGVVAEEKAKTPEQMYYNSTITSFGPMTRDLIGGSVWNRITPLNLEEEGMFTYPLIAGNRFTVGTATVINEEGTQMVTYKLNSKKINVHTKTLVIYPDLEALRTGENAVVLEFDQPTELKEYFGDDHLVLMAITLKADYDAMAPGIQGFREDQELISAMSELID